MNGFPAPTKRYRVYNWWAKLGSIVGAQVGVTQFWFTSHHDSEGSPNGAVRARIQLNPAGSAASPRMSVQTGAGWVSLGGTAAAIAVPESAYHLWQLQVDTVSKRVRLLRDGAEYLTPSWQSDSRIDAAGCLGTSGLGGLVTAGKTTALNIDHDCVFVTEGDDEGDILGTDYAVWAVPPYDDVPGGLWVPNVGPNKWRAVDDPYDLDNQANDFISGTGEVDQMFTLPPYGSGTVDAVGVALVTIKVAGQQEASKILAAFGDGAITAYDIVWNFWDIVPGAAMCGYAQLDPPPAGASAWTRADYNNLRIGVRGTAGITGKIYGMYACVVGSGLSVPPDALPPSSGRVILASGLVGAKPIRGENVPIRTIAGMAGPLLARGRNRGAITLTGINDATITAKGRNERA
jgi:hypothetical protein